MEISPHVDYTTGNRKLFSSRQAKKLISSS